MIINIDINVWAIAGQGKSGFSSEGKLGQAMICGMMDTSGMTAQQVADSCIASCKQWLPDATYIVHLP